MFKIYPAKVSYCQNSDIREVTTALVWKIKTWKADLGLLQDLIMKIFTTVINHFK